MRTGIAAIALCYSSAAIGFLHLPPGFLALPIIYGGETIRQMALSKSHTLKDILNCPPKDPMSNVNRTLIDSIALGSSVALIGLLHANPTFFILPGLYFAEMVRQPITALKKNKKK
ncbi:hypothetical protein COW98_00545 [Candidatus Roizmanbacteria bacterium CG22_combo_CG10-13_8_21_14_all_35_9]|uniref:Uncharacterized protein n=4 Tax=Candidatus Roizmaniibacteriota TaxID=1752723 RepID=A0A2M8F428_9BACT|nr:MAG: hypothetical protein COX47_00745 [Candidatus Roizmanbacteria bacterium CG23_combo_of_CG06-09_8_20_14_all_35_49]PIP63075.1 MAG: hypothetical protein COW98_00545 [Candidatus Roizmanbacteria bacterium CG22_combo_CG10-13_8_21_14_all_35_9]PIY70833.1 MAG: hypothetical protein COY88_03705 [Candidatus Roizmanbacteria bacterium CG_4_10_14_0_8_um_filter_35_28]PJC34039.1 MAG: hypothetical protein CO048_01605 [Candidatus Roizmanbacteria bacterium CG_4_9_14_0_2_um_filter_35_15]